MESEECSGSSGNEISPCRITISPLPEVVRVRIIGKVIDEKYTRMLIREKTSTLMDIVTFDKVQKGYPLLDAEFKSLKSKKLIEGRRPHLYRIGTGSRRDRYPS